jgi:hypothetical protein
MALAEQGVPTRRVVEVVQGGPLRHPVGWRRRWCGWGCHHVTSEMIERKLVAVLFGVVEVDHYSVIGDVTHAPLRACIQRGDVDGGGGR